MNDKLYEALEVCLQALETGADMESVLSRFPDLADELRPLLKVSVKARTLAAKDVPVETMRRGRARVLQHAAGIREAQQASRRPVISFRRFATVMALAIVVFLSSTGLVRASNGALPGDNLYPVKRTWEDVRLALVVNPESREELEYEFERERLEEVDDLLREGRHETISFAGIVTQQDGQMWVVSDIPVQIVDTSQLPAEPVGVGAIVKVRGFTNKQGFVEVEHIEILDFIGFLTPITPVEIEETSEAVPSGNLENEQKQSEPSEPSEPSESSESFSGEKLDAESSPDEGSEGGDRESLDAESRDKTDDKNNSDSDGSISESDNTNSSNDNHSDEDDD